MNAGEDQGSTSHFEGGLATLKHCCLCQNLVSSPHLEHAGHDEGLVGPAHHDPDVEAHPNVTHWGRCSQLLGWDCCWWWWWQFYPCSSAVGHSEHQQGSSKGRRGGGGRRNWLVEKSAPLHPPSSSLPSTHVCHLLRHAHMLRNLFEWI